MNPVVIGNATLYLGDCLEVLRTLADQSVDSIVTDPPYGLSFMGKRWDYDVPGVAVWAECLRVLKPGGHLLAFAGTRTQHRMAVRIEDAGFEIRDLIAWVYGSGFPKSLDVSKAIDKAAGAEREVVGKSARHVSGRPEQRTEGLAGTRTFAETVGMGAYITAPATDAARQWQGWGTALKPALEPITVARKPLAGTVAANVLAHGTGALNIEGCRAQAGDGYTENAVTQGVNTARTSYAPAGARRTFEPSTAGRWPANLIHDGSEEVVALFPESKGQQGAVRGTEPSKTGDANCYGEFGRVPFAARGDTGSAARFFYCAKASRSDRNDGCEGMPEQMPATAVDRPGQAERGTGRGSRSGPRANHHPTVKPTDLMRYLCRLVTPPGGLVLDPFAGSGSTGRGAILEGFRFLGIEREEEYVEIACRRIEDAQRQSRLIA